MVHSGDATFVGFTVWLAVCFANWGVMWRISVKERHCGLEYKEFSVATVVTS